MSSRRALDNLSSDDVRFLEEAAALGSLHVRIPSDRLLAERTGAAPLFPAVERLFLAESLRFVVSAEVVDDPVGDGVRRAWPQQAPISPCARMT